MNQSARAARHLFGGGLSYMGFGGTGAQVRDILHVTRFDTIWPIHPTRDAAIQAVDA